MDWPWDYPKWFQKLQFINVRIEAGDYSSACGDCICDVCKRDYYSHPNYEPWLTLLCNGDLVRL